MGIFPKKQKKEDNTKGELTFPLFLCKITEDNFIIWIEKKLN